MSNASESIEKKLKELQETLQVKNNYLMSINEALKKLSNDKDVVIAEINTVQGAIHAYSESLKLLKEHNPEV